MALIPRVGEVQNISKIYKIALCCIFLSFLRVYESGTLLCAIEKTHIMQ